MKPEIRALEAKAIQLRSQRKAFLSMAEHVRGKLDSINSQLVEIDQDKAAVSHKETMRLRAATGYLETGATR